MADDQTRSIWTHYDGTVLTGPLAGTGAEMEIQPIVHTTWEDWLDQHPETLVPVWETGYEDIEDFASDLIERLPHGSGIDADWRWEYYGDGELRAFNSYHTMDEFGGYSDWVDFSVLFKDIRDVKEFEVECEKEDDAMAILIDYIDETINYYLNS